MTNPERKTASLDDLLELRHEAHSLGLASHHLVNTAFCGLYASVFRGQGLNFEEVREYHRGDDIRSMDWKVTARTNEPHIKVYREERERNVIMCVDLGPHMYFGTRGTLKSIQAARAAALIGWAANSLGDRVGGILFGNESTGMQHFRPTKDRRAIWRLLKEISSAEPPETSIDDSLGQALLRANRGGGTGSLIFIIADFNTDPEKLESALGQLCQKHTVVLAPVDDVADRELPAIGQVLFRGPDGELTEINTNDTYGRERYTEQWQQRRQNLVRLANRMNILIVPVATDKDVHVSLMTGLSFAARTRG